MYGCVHACVCVQVGALVNILALIGRGPVHGTSRPTAGPLVVVHGRRGECYVWRPHRGTCGRGCAPDYPPPSPDTRRSVGGSVGLDGETAPPDRGRGMPKGRPQAQPPPPPPGGMPSKGRGPEPCGVQRSSWAVGGGRQNGRRVGARGVGGGTRPSWWALLACGGAYDKQASVLLRASALPRASTHLQEGLGDGTRPR